MWGSDFKVCVALFVDKDFGNSFDPSQKGSKCLTLYHAFAAKLLQVSERGPCNMFWG